MLQPEWNMTPDDIPVSVRAVLSKWLVPVLVALLAITAVGGYITYDAHVNGAQTVLDEQTSGTWTVESGFDHRATVERATTVFEPGDELENRPLYFTNAMPTLDGTYTLTHDNTDGNAAMVSGNLSLVIRSVEETGDGEVVHWQSREPLETIQPLRLADGAEHTTTVSIDIAKISTRIESIEEELGASPGEIEVLVVADTEIESTVAGERFKATRTDRLQVTPNEAVYRVSADEQDQQSYEATDQVRRTIPQSRLALFGGPLVFVLGGACTLAVWIANRRDLLVVSDPERERRAYEAERSDAVEWISTVTIPDRPDRTTVPVDSLADLVDIAIDSDRRVLEDGNQYVVFVDDLVYQYTAPKPDDPLPEADNAGTATEHRSDQGRNDAVETDGEHSAGEEATAAADSEGPGLFDRSIDRLTPDNTVEDSDNADGE